MDKDQLAANYGLTDPGCTYDLALPQWWWDVAYAATGENPIDYAIVWGYTPKSNVFGSAVALDAKAHDYMTRVWLYQREQENA